MKAMKRVALAAALGALACVATPAIAATQLLTFSGTLDYGNNSSTSSAFAAEGTNLTGKTYTVSLSYDPALFTTPGSSSCGTISNTSCQFFFSAARPLTEITKVGNTTVSSSVTTGSITLSSSGAGSPDQFGFAINSSSLNISGSFQDSDGFFPTQARVNEPIFSNFSNLTLKPGASFQQNGPGYSFGDAPASLSASYTIGAVPEPATWAMMLLGFGAVGGAARYRRRKTNVAYA